VYSQTVHNSVKLAETRIASTASCKFMGLTKVGKGACSKFDDEELQIPHLDVNQTEISGCRPYFVASDSE
jgi:hypothetical protein